MTGTKLKTYRWYNVDYTQRDGTPHSDVLSFEQTMEYALEALSVVLPPTLQLSLTTDYFAPILCSSIERYFGYDTVSDDALAKEDLFDLGLAPDVYQKWLADLDTRVALTLLRLGYDPVETDVDFIDVSPARFSVVLSWKFSV